MAVLKIPSVLKTMYMRPGPNLLFYRQSFF